MRVYEEKILAVKMEVKKDADAVRMEAKKDIGLLKKRSSLLKIGPRKIRCYCCTISLP